MPQNPEDIERDRHHCRDQHGDRHRQYLIPNSRVLPKHDNWGAKREKQLANRNHRAAGIASGNGDRETDRIGQGQHLSDVRRIVINAKRGDHSDHHRITESADFEEQFKLSRIALLQMGQGMGDKHPAQADDAERDGSGGYMAVVCCLSCHGARSDSAHRANRQARWLGVQAIDQNPAYPVIQGIGAEQHPLQLGQRPDSKCSIRSDCTSCGLSPNG